MRTFVRLPSWAVMGLAVLASGALPMDAQQVDPELFDHLRWTNVGIARGPPTAA